MTFTFLRQKQNNFLQNHRQMNFIHDSMRRFPYLGSDVALACRCFQLPCKGALPTLYILKSEVYKLVASLQTRYTLMSSRKALLIITFDLRVGLERGRGYTSIPPLAPLPLPFHLQVPQNPRRIFF